MMANLTYSRKEEIFSFLRIHKFNTHFFNHLCIYYEITVKEKHNGGARQILEDAQQKTRFTIFHNWIESMNVNEPRLELDETHISFSLSFWFIKRCVIYTRVLYTRIQLRFVTALHRGLVYQLRSQHPKVGSSYADRIPFQPWLLKD